MSEQKLETFKIGDKHKPRVASGASKDKDKGAEAPAETATLGFARIESILDNEPPGAVADKLRYMTAQLTQREAEAKSAKDKTAFKKARLAVDRARELLEYLFQTKAALMAAAEQAQTPTQK